MLKFGIIGLGQAGSNVAEYGATKGFVAMAVNTAKIDLNTLRHIPSENRLFLKGYDGAGRNRDIGKEAMVENAEEFYNLCKNKFSQCDAVFVATAGGGGTGSGALPVAVDILQEICNNINVIFILPDNLESTSAKINSYDCFAELSENPHIGSIFIIDNQRGKEKLSREPKFKVHKEINKQIIDILFEVNELTEKSSYTNNFDNRDMLDILQMRGCTLVAKCEFNENEIIDENDLSARIRKSWIDNYSPQYNVENTLKAGIIGKINSLNSDKLNLAQLFNDNCPYDIKDSMYEPENNKTCFYSIFSGLEFPQSRLYEMKNDVERVQDELLKRINTSQNQKLTLGDWKIPKIETPMKNNSESLSERLKKFK